MLPSGKPSIDRVQSALSYVSPDVSRNDWYQLMLAVHDATGGSVSGMELFDEWSSEGASYKTGEVPKRWNSINGNNKTTAGTLFYHARQNGWRPDDSPCLTVVPDPANKGCTDQAGRGSTKGTGSGRNAAPQNAGIKRILCMRGFRYLTTGTATTTWLKS